VTFVSCADSRGADQARTTERPGGIAERVFHACSLLKRLGQDGRCDPSHTTIEALTQRKQSKDPNAEINQGITLLRSAYAMFTAAGDKKSLGFKLGLPVGYRATNYKKAVQTALAIAMAYAARGEERLRDQFINQCRADFKKYKDARLEQANRSDFMTSHLKAGVTERYEKTTDVTDLFKQQLSAEEAQLGITLAAVKQGKVSEGLA
jgi:hypothetical protein